ncbi:MAG: hypothetical protein H0T89_14080 [Deltaproteobacteria bacterium]|nr:hypothetical protein [Deltaproteobacteria bacterium]MDQ3297172.1 hypothetical protein [Myxococcota bacterium]
MSRLALALSIIASLSFSATTASARHSSSTPPSMRFAEPPHTSVSNDVHTSVNNDVKARFDRIPDRAAVRAKLAAARAANLAHFRSYQKKGAFPNNTYTSGKLNVWLDDAGNLCAAATIIKLSGQDALVARVAAQDNFIRLADVKHGPLMDWILTSGLTHDEIVAIQEPMMRVTDEPSLEPAQPIVVDARLRRLENRRLIAKYRQVDARIVKQQRRSLDAAVDRLMAKPRLAARFLAS